MSAVSSIRGVRESTRAEPNESPVLSPTSMTITPPRGEWANSPEPLPMPAYASRALNPVRLAAIEHHAGRTILDAGCGNGAYVLHLADQFQIRGIDWQPFDTWKVRPELFSVGDVTRLELPEDSVETVVSFECLEHFPDPGAILRNFRRICSRNVILTVPNCDITAGMRASLLTYYHYTDPSHLNFFTLDEIANLCEKAGFRVGVRSLINPLDLDPLLGEGYDFAGPAGRFARWWLRKRQRVTYQLTCLVVAEKA